MRGRAPLGVSECFLVAALDVVVLIVHDGAVGHLAQRCSTTGRDLLSVVFLGMASWSGNVALSSPSMMLSIGELDSVGSLFSVPVS